MTGLIDFKLTKIRFEMSRRRAASLSPKLIQVKVFGQQLSPHVADSVRTYKKYIFVSFKGSKSLMNVLNSWIISYLSWPFLFILNSLFVIILNVFFRIKRLIEIKSSENWNTKKSVANPHALQNFELSLKQCLLFVRVRSFLL